VLLCLSSSHQNASLEVLEKLSVSAVEATRTLIAGSDFISGAVVLATCNRFEAYLDIDEPLTAATAIAVASTLNALSAASGIDVAVLRSSVTVHEGDAVARHLFAVTSGLESVVVGEDEISGQVRRALDAARFAATTSRDLERLFQRATHTSRGVKNETGLGGAERSLARLALDLASSRIADWSAASVLVVGTGRYAATTVRALRGLGVADIRVFSLTGRATPFAAKHGLRADIDFDTDVDVVITCASSAVIGPERFTGERPRLVIDLALPRNIDPAVGALPGVELLDLETIRLHAPLPQLESHDRAHALVSEAAADFVAESVAEPAVVALRTHILATLDAEIDRARARGEGEQTIAALRHFAGVMLHEPSVRARELASEGRAEEFVAGLRAIYGIHPTPPSGGDQEQTA
jgi:glutamyl-tRNA reductase